MWLIYAAVIYFVLHMVTLLFDESLRRSEVYDKYLSDYSSNGGIRPGCGCLISIVIAIILSLVVGN